ncbi:hypothetical protein CASFOL_013136 [Castilleja foliolosa]|uniref:PB1 domain-containing protein n=1 Tax=Castilleja foliolosa TaxID=1961234 RepID=A0ABD3DJ52_9LAMI
MAQKLKSSNNGMRTIKFLYSYGGKIVLRPVDRKLHYTGGHTRIISVDRSITYPELIVKFWELCGSSSIDLKCKLPDEDLDLLVTIRSDEELRYVIEDYERVSPGEKIRAVLFPTRSAKKISVPSSTVSYFDFPSSTKPRRVLPTPSPAILRPAVQRPPIPRPAVKKCSYPAKKASPPSSPKSCLDFPSGLKPCVPVPPSVVPRFLYPAVEYPVVAGNSCYSQARSPMHFYHVPHRN